MLSDGQAHALFDRPIARKTDPVTLVEAGEKVRRSGKVARQKAAVLEALRRRPNSTSAELTWFMALDDRHICSRRLPDLEADGLAERLPPRICGVTGSRCITWRAKDPGARSHDDEEDRG